MKWKPALLLIPVISLPAGAVQADLPLCGGEIDGGGGFTIELIMQADSTWAELRYAVPRDQIHATDVSPPRNPVLRFGYRLPMSAGHTEFGFYGIIYQLIPPGGRGQDFILGSLVLECGRGRRLTAGFAQASYPYQGPFNASRSEIPACIATLRRSGRYTLRFARTPAARPSLVLSGRLPLAEAMDRAERFWRREAALGRAGRCAYAPQIPPF